MTCNCVFEVYQVQFYVDIDLLCAYVSEGVGGGDLHTAIEYILQVSHKVCGVRCGCFLFSFFQAWTSEKITTMRYRRSRKKKREKRGAVFCSRLDWRQDFSVHNEIQSSSRRGREQHHVPVLPFTTTRTYFAH